MRSIILADKDIEVTLNKVNKSFTVNIRMNCSPMQLMTPEAKQLAGEKTQFAVNYLINEGFIDKKEIRNWYANIITVPLSNK